MPVEIATHEQIRQLACRYAEAVDSRDLDGLVECFVPDVQVGRGTFGRPALRDWFDGVRTFGISIHFIGNHRISIVDDDRASGVVYCRAEHEVGDEWVVMIIQYWDDYARIDGEWLIRRRKEKVWYGVQKLPGASGAAMDRWPGREPKVAALPAEWPSWRAFWGRTTDQ
jgi:hypothetical protein